MDGQRITTKQVNSYLQIVYSPVPSDPSISPFLCSPEPVPNLVLRARQHTQNNNETGVFIFTDCLFTRVYCPVSPFLCDPAPVPNSVLGARSPAHSAQYSESSLSHLQDFESVATKQAARHNSEHNKCFEVVWGKGQVEKKMPRHKLFEILKGYQ